MAIDPLATWQSTLNALPKVGDNSWTTNFSNWYADRIIGITTNPANLVPVGFLFTFAKPIFQAQLLTLAPTNSALAGITGFANAWAAALTASTVAVAAGSAIPPPSPATIFGTVISTIIDTASIAAGKAKILELVTAPAVGSALLSEFPVKFRDATILLKITVTGLNSVPPPPGPNPLSAPSVPLI